MHSMLKMSALSSAYIPVLGFALAEAVTSVELTAVPSVPETAVATAEDCAAGATGGTAALNPLDTRNRLDRCLSTEVTKRGSAGWTETLRKTESESVAT